MSVQALRNGVLADLAEQKRAFESMCVIRTEDTLDQIRLNQGVIRGLQMAIEIVENRATNLHG